MKQESAPNPDDFRAVYDFRILEYASSHGFLLVSTDGDFVRLLSAIPTARVVILRSCDYPTHVAA